MFRRDPSGKLELTACAAVLAFGLVAREASAQQSAEVGAQALFERGRDLLRVGKAEQACPLLAESQRLDPATGTFVALALCHEAEGKMASAWAEFVDAEVQSRAANRADRQKVAFGHAKALKFKLSTIEVQVPSDLSGLPGLEIKRNGELYGRGSWNVAVPVDGADYLIAIDAPGKLHWEKRIHVKPTSDAVVVAAPNELQDAPAPPVAVTPATVPKREPTPISPTRPTSAHRSFGTFEWAGIATAGAGVVGLGLGGYFLSSALSKKANANADCIGNQCGTAGYEQRDSAVSRGNTATVFGIAGGALIATGATLFLIGRTRGAASADSSASNAPRPRLAVDASPFCVSARLWTAF